MKRLVALSLLIWPFSGFGGQHSGLGPGTPFAPIPRPAPIVGNRGDAIKIENLDPRDLSGAFEAWRKRALDKPRFEKDGAARSFQGGSARGN